MYSFDNQTCESCSIMPEFTKPDTATVLTDLQAGLNQSQIAEKHGFQKMAVSRLVSSVKQSLGLLNDIELSRKDSFVLLHGISLGLQHDVLELVGVKLHEEIEKIRKGVAGDVSLGQLIMTLKSLSINQAVIYDKLRLERGQSTSNMGLAGLVHHLHSKDGGLIDEETGDFKQSLIEARPHALAPVNDNQQNQ